MRKSIVEKSRKQGNIWGVAIDSTSKGRVLRFVRDSLMGIDTKRPFFIVTPNPEIVSLASKDAHYAKIINSANLSLPDAVGLVQATRFWGLPAPKNLLLRVPVSFFQGLWVGLSTFVDREWLFREIKPIKGREVFLDLMKLANKKRWRVFLFGGKDGEAEEAKKNLEGSLKSVSLKALDGPLLNETGEPINANEARVEKRAIATINAFKPHILFLAFTPPKQEKWFDRNRRGLRIGGAMTVGGTFRYIGGRSTPPPAWMARVGLEWLWRLVKEPYRIGRVLTAFPLFPLRVFVSKVKNS